MSNIPFTASRESSEFEFVSGNKDESVPGSKSSANVKPTAAVVEKVDSVVEEEGLFGWVKGTGGILSKVAEKTVSNLITTLDPQMKDYIHSGGNSVRVIVASDEAEVISAVKDAFHSIFGLATIYGLPSQPKNVAAQPVGFASGKQGAIERMQLIRETHAEAKEEGTILVSCESFLLEVGDEEWLEQCIFILDNKLTRLCQYTQPTSVPYHVIQKLQESTSSEYPLSWSGFSVAFRPVISECLNVATSKWHEALSGLPRKVLLTNAAKSLVYAYKLSQPQAKVDEI